MPGVGRPRHILQGRRNRLPAAEPRCALVPVPQFDGGAARPDQRGLENHAQRHVDQLFARGGERRAERAAGEHHRRAERRRGAYRQRHALRRAERTGHPDYAGGRILLARNSHGRLQFRPLRADHRQAGENPLPQIEAGLQSRRHGVARRRRRRRHRRRIALGIRDGGGRRRRFPSP